MKKIISLNLFFLLLIGSVHFDAIAGSPNFQEKKSVIVPGAGATYLLNAYKLTSIIGEALGGESSNSANFSLAGGYFGDTQTTPGFDNTPPTTPIVTDDGAYTTSNTSLHASWSSEDPESGIAEYLYAVPGLTSWISFGLNTEITLTDLNLVHGRTYYFTVKARNNAGLESAIGFSDGITINLSEPVISNLTPANLSKVYESGYIQIIVTASDNDGDSLEYQILIDGNIKKDWSSANTFSWNISSFDVGRPHQILVNVRDGNGAVVSAQSKIFILRKPIEPPERSGPRGDRCFKGKCPVAD